MKRNKIKSLLLASASIISLSSEAQVEKGTKFIGGSSSLVKSNNSSSNSNFSSENNSTNFRLEPRVGYYISKSWAIGLGFNLDIGKSNIYSNYTTLSNYSKAENSDRSLGLNLFARYNKPLSKRFAFFVNGVMSTGIWGEYKTYREDMNNGTKTVRTQTTERKFGQSYHIDIRPGVTYFVTPRFGIEATFASVYADFGSTKGDASNQFTKSNALTVGYNLYPVGFGLGVHYYIAPKAKKQIVEDVE